MNIGDFSVARSALDFARERQSERSARSRGVDEEQRAPVTTDAREWANDPNGLDFPGIDTPSESPVVLPKDQMDPAPTDLTARASNEAPVDPTPPEREGGLFQRDLSRQDVSLSPEEARGEVGTDTQPVSATASVDDAPFAGDVEADLAFEAAERQRLFEP